MTIKCAFWDVMKKTELSVNAKANAGEALGLLARVYNLPLTVLKVCDTENLSDFKLCNRTDELRTLVG